METPFSKTGFTPEAAFAGAAQGFFELLKTFGMPAAGAVPDWSALASPLAGQFEQWLRLSQAGAPWFGAAARGGAASWPFGPLPLVPAAPKSAEAQRTLELLARLGQLQAELAAYWSEVANGAAQRFVARVAGTAAAAPGIDSALKLYELWVNCAEEAYGALVHREQFARLQSELGNVGAELLLEQRRHAETLARAFGLPTREEHDTLAAQLRELRDRLASMHTSPAAKPAGAADVRNERSTAARTARPARPARPPRPAPRKGAPGRKAARARHRGKRR